MLTLLAAALLAQTPQADTGWYKQAKFGMFIHWGIYSVPADDNTIDGGKSGAEWYLSNKHVQVRDYEKFASQFDPEKFNAHQWVKIAKDAGMRYIVVTTKHHDGFCMWDTKLSDYSVTKATPWKHDPMKELQLECAKQGIQLCFYHSIMDWHHPDYLPRRAWDDRPTTGADLNKYIDTFKGQLKELLTGYGKIGLIWFDGGWEHNAKELRSEEVNAMIKSLQPGILINDRNQLPADFSTPEQTIPAGALPNGRLWETCMTMNNTWGYAKDDQNWKSTTDLTRKLCDIASKGGNFLLNVGPTAEGLIPEPSVERLAEVGKWMKVNHEAIYGAEKSPFKKVTFNGRCTQKGNSLYLEVFVWPQDGKIVLNGLQTKIRRAKVLGGEMLKVDGNQILGTPKKLDAIATVVKVDLAGPVQIEAPGPLVLGPGAFDLSASDAEVIGQTAHVETHDGLDNIGYWTNASDKVSWKFSLKQAGKYRVVLEYACDQGSEGATVTVGSLSVKVASTGSWGNFTKLDLGVIELPAGVQSLLVSPVDVPHGAVMNLRALHFVPAE